MFEQVFPNQLLEKIKIDRAHGYKKDMAIELQRCYAEIERQREQLNVALDALKQLRDLTPFKTVTHRNKIAAEALKAMGVGDANKT